MSSGRYVARRTDGPSRDATLGHRGTPEDVERGEAYDRWRIRFEAAERTVRAAHPTWDDRRVQEEAASMLGRHT